MQNLDHSHCYSSLQFNILLEIIAYFCSSLWTGMKTKCLCLPLGHLYSAYFKIKDVNLQKYLIPYFSLFSEAGTPLLCFLNFHFQFSFLSVFQVRAKWSLRIFSSLRNNITNENILSIHLSLIFFFLLHFLSLEVFSLFIE